MNIGSKWREAKEAEGGRRWQVASSPLIKSLLRQQMGALGCCHHQDIDAEKPIKAGVSVKPL